MEGISFGTGIHCSGEGKQAKDLIGTELHLSAAALPVPELIQLQVFVEQLQGKVTNIAGIIGSNIERRTHVQSQSLNVFFSLRFLIFCEFSGPLLKVRDGVLILILVLADITDRFNGSFASTDARDMVFLSDGQVDVPVFLFLLVKIHGTDLLL